VKHIDAHLIYVKRCKIINTQLVHIEEHYQKTKMNQEDVASKTITKKVLTGAVMLKNEKKMNSIH
jgi:hypothetical protein